ncbi:MAG: DNA replication and repair protein RecF [Akkermansiaceae bacterium]
MGVIESLRLVNFRCFEEASLSLGGEGRIFVGENAQGKTSLLEAVCLLLRLQSPRARQTRQLIREGAEGFGIAGEAWGRELQVRGDRKGLALKADGAEVTARREYLEESGLVVWMGNEDLDLVRGGGESRRRFLDFIATQIDSEYRHHWSRYRKALSARNRYLKSYSAREGVVMAYTKMLLEHGSEMIRLRKELCEKLVPRAAENQKVISGTGEELAMTYVDRSKGDLAAAFAEVEESETRRGVTLAGPHRDDVKLMIAGRSAKDFGSEGQQRTVALALKLAQGEVLRELGTRSPVYLIDDVFGELDLRRRNALMQLLPGDAQKLITTTNLDWFERGDLELGVTEVKEGALGEG